jgi:hypothetical protein
MCWLEEKYDTKKKGWQEYREWMVGGDRKRSKKAFGFAILSEKNESAPLPGGEVEEDEVEEEAAASLQAFFNRGERSYLYIYTHACMRARSQRKSCAGGWLGK